MRDNIKYVRKAFGCGIHIADFTNRYEALPEEEKDRLRRVGSRMLMTLRLRYQLAVSTNPFMDGVEQHFFESSDWPSLEVYLLCTCLDMIAGQPRHKDFKAWVREQSLTEMLSIDDVIKLYESYQNTHGVGRNLRQLFENLPQVMKQWLANNIMIDEGKFSPVPHALPEDTAKLIKHLVNYFYDIRRSNFTHSGLTYHTEIADDIYAFDENRHEQWWAVDFAFSFKNKPHKEALLHFRQGLDLATILRLILHTVALQKLGIEVTQNIIQGHIVNYSRLHALYKFLDEVHYNASRMKHYAAITEQISSRHPIYIRKEGVSALSTTWAVRLSERLITEYSLERGLREVVLEYIAQVKELDNIITDFNKQHQNSIYRLGDEQEFVRSFLDTLTKSTAFNAVIEMPNRKSMTNMWIVIRDPCYT